MKHAQPRFAYALNVSVFAVSASGLPVNDFLTQIVSASHACDVILGSEAVCDAGRQNIGQDSTTKLHQSAERASLETPRSCLCGCHPCLSLWAAISSKLAVTCDTPCRSDFGCRMHDHAMHKTLQSRPLSRVKSVLYSACGLGRVGDNATGGHVSQRVS